ncbi:MAG: asparagine synthase (glutamine-hydrolyzing) [Halieaceae bacterium]|nr:asparagine synthase (glutamine-hydrolyzing) [Halieaceae bacterium]
MCGLTGILYESLSAEAAMNSCERMTRALEHRGPDHEGFWIEPSQGVVFGHRRLSIIDLSVAGHQPMQSPSGRYVIAFNGEIYNHREIRAELRTHLKDTIWRGTSDTETLIAAIESWGFESALRKLNGMFSIAVWDMREKCLYLARDRIGEKPMYYGMFSDNFLFASELKAMHAFSDWRGEIDKDALALFFRHNYIPAPKTIYKGIYKLLPAHYIVVSEGGSKVSEPKCYWNISSIAMQDRRRVWNSDSDVVDEAERRLRRAVSLRMESDVALGAFLSGGYDSSTIVALMQEYSTTPVKTFSIGFYEDRYNEAQYAKSVASHLQTDHTELYVTSDEAMNIIPRLPTIYDEPFADSSQIPTFLVSELARTNVKVVLSGDGGDELFCGYDRYNVGYQFWKKLSILPHPLRYLLAIAIRSGPVGFFEILQKLLPQRFKVSNLRDKLPKLAAVLNHRHPADLYHELVSHDLNPSDLVLGSIEPETIMKAHKLLPDLADFRELMMYLDMVTYLPGDILNKVDRASMAVGLEARVPMIDHELIEFVWSLPLDYKTRGLQGKWLLREVLHRHVPKSLMDRPKMGFGVPVGDWLRGPLRDWAEELLSSNKLRDHNLLNSEKTHQMWREHLSSQKNWQYQLWNVLMFQAWFEQNQSSLVR